MMRWNGFIRLFALFAVLTFVLTGCGQKNLSALDPQGPVAEEQLWLMKLALTIMIIVVIVVFVLSIYVLVRYRKRKGQTGIPEQVEGNHKLEMIWTIIPFILLLILAVPTVSATFKLAKDYSNDPNAVKVKVTAHQFWWEFEYPDLGVITSSDLWIPVGKRIAFDLTSVDVKHSFWVPALGGKQDTNSGSHNNMYLIADKPGWYQGKCAELCGASHALMDFKVHAVTQEEFDSWVEKMKTPVVASADTQKGETIFKESCISCHAVGGQGGRVGPDLTNFANRHTLAGFKPNDEESLKAWISDPQAVKPGNLMPNLGLSDDQVNELAKYLRSLK